jgi:hypothetical protein
VTDMGEGVVPARGTLSTGPARFSLLLGVAAVLALVLLVAPTVWRVRRVIEPRPARPAEAVTDHTRVSVTRD